MTTPRVPIDDALRRLGIIEADDWVTAARIDDGAVGTAALAAASVTAAKLGSDVPRVLVAVKESDTVRNNTDVLTDDPDLSVSVEANSSYAFEAWLPQNATAAADFKQGLSYPSGSSGYWGWSQAAAQNALVLGANRVQGTNGTPKMSHIAGSLITAGTAGTFAIQWAQQTAEATDATLYAGAWLKVTKLA